MNQRKLGFHGPGATELEVAAGLNAANRFLQRAGVTPEVAMRGALAREAWGDSGLAPLFEPSPEDQVHSEAWDGALESALMACYGGRPAPLEACLFLTE